MSLDIEEGKVVLLDGVLTEGFELSDFNLALITAGDILGRQKLRKYSTSGSRKQIRYFSDLNPGTMLFSRYMESAGTLAYARLNYPVSTGITLPSSMQDRISFIFL